MKVGIDISQIAFTGSGVARYTTGLVRSMMKNTGGHEYTFLFTSLRKKPPQSFTDAIRPPHRLISYPLPPTLTSYMWNTLHVLPVENIIGDVDVFISSDWTQPPTKSAKKLTVIHDMIPYLYPETSTTNTKFSLSGLRISPNIVETHKKRLDWVKKEGDHVITDSMNTKNDIVRLLGIPDDKITVVYPAVEVPHITPSDKKTALEQYALHRPFILTVGKIEPRKNIARLIRAFVDGQLYEDVDLVIVGAHGWGELEHIDIPGNAEGAIRFLGFVSEDRLHALYATAEIFAMPSLYEGFGYPIIEAMAHGCPVATSNTSSLGELAKGYGALFNPESIDDISRTLKTLHNDPSKRKTMSQKAKAYAHTFTSTRFANDLTKVIQTVV